MTGMPRTLTILNPDLTAKVALKRVGSRDEVSGRRLAEADYDQLIATHAESFASALCEAGLIRSDSSLWHLGKGLNIDLLFAEVESETEVFRRFVIVEDKLARNPEAHRHVLAQLLDYGSVLSKTDVESLRELFPQSDAWLMANEDLISDKLAQRDFLMVVCGDAIQPRLIGYLE